MDAKPPVPIGRMMADVGRLHATRIDQLLERHGLFRGQAILLIILSENDGMTHSNIAERLQISPAAATKVIKRLEKMNYLRRYPDPDDERVSRVYLQEDGRAVIAQIRAVFQQINRILLADFTLEEECLLREYLRRMHANLLAAEEEHFVLPQT